MAIKTYKPTTNGRRNMSVTDYSSQLDKVSPERSLLAPLKKNSGRNSYGRITVKRQKADMPATVQSIEYDPNRSAFIALIQYEDGTKAYITAPHGLKKGDTVVSGAAADIKPGNALPLSAIPTGTFIHNIELYPGRGAQFARAAGIQAQLMAKEGGYALLRLPSGELRNVSADCMATIGQVSNIDHENVKIGKAGRKRLMGWSHEPERPPARRRRGQEPCRTSRSLHTLGQACSGLQDQIYQEGFRQDDRKTQKRQVIVRKETLINHG